MKQQLLNRLGILKVRHILEQFNAGHLGVEIAAHELGVSRSTLFHLRKRWLLDTRVGTLFQPGTSGGNHHAPWPDDAVAFLRDVLAGPRPYAYAFAAYEMERLHNFHADRAQVRLWALRNGLAQASPKPRDTPHYRRFQRTHIGELWQLDATPYAWFGPGTPQYPMLNMLDDCSRLQLAGALYEHENLAAYIHFLKTAFETHGLPLEVYVDHAAFFKSPLEDGSTRLKNRLLFYGVTFRYASSAQAKGKVERIHFVWQERLPPYFTHTGVPDTLAQANAQIALLLDWRNTHEPHREIGMTAAAAWARAAAEGRSRLRPRPACPWWEYVWSEMACAVVQPRRRMRLGVEEVPVNAEPGQRVVVCTHVDGFHSVLRDWPKKECYPVVLFTDRPREIGSSSTVPVRF